MCGANAFVVELNRGLVIMGSVSFLLVFLLSYSDLLLSSAEEERKQPATCLLFDCDKVRLLPFPFNESNPDCGFSQAVNCSHHKSPEIQLERGGRYYELKNSSQGQGDTNTIVIQDHRLQQHLKHNRCDLIDNLPLPPSPPSVYFLPAPALTNLTLFKCPRNNKIHAPTTYTYKLCNDFLIHYDLARHIPDTLSLPACSIIQYPVNISLGLDNLVALLTSDITLEVHLPTECRQCRFSGGQCQDDKGGIFRCAPHRAEKHTEVPTGAQHPYKKKSKTKELAIGFGVSGGIIAFIIMCFLIKQPHKRKCNTTFLSTNTSSDPSSMLGSEVTSAYFGLPIFHYNELEKATDYFNPDKVIGDGGFGTVYHGRLQDGREVAVKRLYRGNYRRVAQFMNEVEILTRLRHPNLVSLYGCTSRHSRELLLVYEFIPSGTVADHLHGDRADSCLLTWSIRLSIAIETATALCYLHASEVVHRDVKTNNILLDHSFCVKVADFGISRLFPFDVTHVSTAPQGTPGYVDPEYHQCYQLTEKSDVYSFGVVLIELISSLPAVDITRNRNEINLSNYAVNKIQQGAFHELIDPRIGVNRMTTMVAELAFRCLQSDKETRPSMDEVLVILKEIENDKHEFENLDRADNYCVGSSLGSSKSVPLMTSQDTVTTTWTSVSTRPNTA